MLSARRDARSCTEAAAAFSVCPWPLDRSAASTDRLVLMVTAMAAAERFEVLPSSTHSVPPTKTATLYARLRSLRGSRKLATSVSWLVPAPLHTYQYRCYKSSVKLSQSRVLFNISFMSRRWYLRAPRDWPGSILCSLPAGLPTLRAECLARLQCNTPHNQACLAAAVCLARLS